MKASVVSTAAIAALALLSATFGITSASQATVIYAGNFGGNECGGQGGFANCYATTTGTHQGAEGGGSPAIYKRESSGGQDFGNFGSITGGEFVVSLNGATNELSFTYTAGANDPEIHYFAIKQANGFALFYDLSAPITSYTVDLDLYFPNNPGFSHITFFDTGSTTRVPEPATLALFGLGLLGLGIMVRRRKAA
jgi:hypothetical protein